MKYYWELVLRDGSKREIPPQGVAQVRKWIENHETIRLAKTGDVSPYEVRYFSPTSKIYKPPNLLEDVAQAFKEPIIEEDESIACRWVKKAVTTAMWERHYSNVPGYRKIGDKDGMALIAFLQPIHLVDLNNVDYLTPEEINNLTTR